MKRIPLLLVLLIAASSASAQQMFVEFSGVVTQVTGTRQGPLASVQIGDPVSGVAVYDPGLFSMGSGDGSTWLYVRAPWSDSSDLMRTRVLVGGVAIDTEEYAFRLGTSGLDSAHFPPASEPRDRFFVVDWSSPYDLGILGYPGQVDVAPLRQLFVAAYAPGSSDFVAGPLASLYMPLDFALATEMSGTIVDGIGTRVTGPGVPANVWSFDFREPPADPERWAISVQFRIESLRKVTCQNRMPWVDFGWPWPDHPLTCAESMRPQ